MATATVSVILRRDDGVTVSREFTIKSPPWPAKPMSQTKFKEDVRKQAIRSINAVLGVPKEVEISTSG